MATQIGRPEQGPNINNNAAVPNNSEGLALRKLASKKIHKIGQN